MSLKVHHHFFPPRLHASRACLCCVLYLLCICLVTAYQQPSSTFATSHLTQTLSASSITPTVRIVTTKYGSLRGNLVKLSSMGSRNAAGGNKVELADVEAFLGVPYATPPTGGLRFMPPVTPSHWRGVRLATSPSAVCPQQIPADVLAAVRARDQAEARRRTSRARYEQLRRLVPLLGNQSEDCLYLNVYVPVPSGTGQNRAQGTSSWSGNSADWSGEPGGGNGPLPVLVLLAGESFSWGAGSVFDGSLQAAFGKILIVTLNARLGVLGFLPAFVEGSVRGNYGLMDTVAALHWVQENIAVFGGEPTSVTLLGIGHGAALAHLLALSPMAKGLFSRVVLLSGSALSPWAIVRDPEHYARELGRKLNCTNLETMVDCLRSVPVSVLTSTSVPVPEHLTAFGPILDSVVVPLDPRRLYNAQLYKQLTSKSTPLADHVPSRSFDLLLGATSSDVPCIFSEDELKSGLAPERRDRLLRSLVRNLYDYQQQAIYLTLHGEYDGWDNESKPSKEALESTVSVLSDALTLVPLMQTANLHSMTTEQSSSTKKPIKTFFYMFDVNAATGVDQEKLNRFESVDSSANQVICSNGAHLAYLLGDPLAQMQFGSNGNSQLGPFYYEHNLTWAHAAVSQMFMQYMVNFVRYGDPNTRSPHFSHDSSSTFRRQSPSPPFWPVYTSSTQTYLAFVSLAPSTSSHSRNHRLALWMQLIPRLLLDDREYFLLTAKNDRPQLTDFAVLNRSANQSANPNHHLLLEQDPRHFEGVVRSPEMIQHSQNLSQQAPANAPSRNLSRANNFPNSSSPTHDFTVNLTHVHLPETDELPPVVTAHAPTSQNSFGQFRSTFGLTGSDVSHWNSLLIATAIGCALLLLNVVVCSALYRQCVMNRRLIAARQASGTGPMGAEANKGKYTKTKPIKEPTCEPQTNSTPTRKYRDASPPRHLRIESENYNVTNGTLSRRNGQTSFGPSYNAMYP